MEELQTLVLQFLDFVKPYIFVICGLIIVSWGVITSTKRILKIRKSTKRIRKIKLRRGAMSLIEVAVPLVLAVAYYFNLRRGIRILVLVEGVVVGAVASSCYKIAESRVLKAIRSGRD